MGVPFIHKYKSFQHIRPIWVNMYQQLYALQLNTQPRFMIPNKFCHLFHIPLLVTPRFDVSSKISQEVLYVKLWAKKDGSV